MAESSSSGEESSEEEEEDESASPSLRGATSPITATNRHTSGEKRALYSERGYLNSLSRQERRRIKREIRKGRKLGEIIDNRGGRGIGNGNTFGMVSSWRMRVAVHLCTSRGYSDRAEHLEIAAHALEIIVVCITAHNRLRYDHFVALIYRECSFLSCLLHLCPSLRTFCGHEEATNRTLEIRNY